MNSRLRRRLSTSVEGLGDLRLSRKGLWLPCAWVGVNDPSLSGAHSLNRVERKWG